MLADAGLPENRLLGVGVSAPGPLDAEEGRILNPPRFDAWHGIDLVTPLKARLGIPVYLANLATACAVYCHHRPETADSDNFLLLIVNEGGVGSGIISQGKLLHSAGVRRRLWLCAAMRILPAARPSAAAAAESEL